MPPTDSETARWFAEEVQPHEPILRGYLHRFAAWADIDDLVQETYTRLLRVREKGEVRSTRGLLFATARNAALDLFRRRATARTETGLADPYVGVADEAPSPSEAASRRQEIDLLEAAILALPDRCREVFILRRFENLSHRQIATRMGISENTVEVQLTKALRRCETFFERKGALPRE